MQVILQPVWKR